MKLPLISAGEFFELLRPAAYGLSVLLSTWVLASARRRGFQIYLALFISLGTFVLPFVVLPLYLIILIVLKPAPRSSPTPGTESPTEEFHAPGIRYRFLLPAAYGLLLLAASAAYLYRDYNSVDAHLARAAQAKLSGPPVRIIREYRAALALEDNPHTHKLLALELADAGQWAEAVKELQRAEQGGEPDNTLPFRLGQAFANAGDFSRASQEYSRFLNSSPCQLSLPDERCEVARKQLALMLKGSPR